MMELRTHPAPTSLGAEANDPSDPCGYDPDGVHVADDLVVQYRHMTAARPATLLDWMSAYRLHHAGGEWTLHRCEHWGGPWRHDANVVQMPAGADPRYDYLLEYDGQEWSVREQPRYREVVAGTCDP